ncbi:HNH endonuclease [Burkholderia cenocepacia]|uniref:HNH endonuclease n=1 Tax=Burkholderia cenocepacia TaxID=95486 RepID=UPI002B24CF89|nr:HNH endonuclease [Burkholderia cenocepacia]MEB2605017.1 HNH endonuclease [Burkholderia cenocepacia]
MDEKISRIIQRLGSWGELGRFRENAESQERLTPEVQSALDRRAVELARDLVAQKTGLNLSNLSPAEDKIVLAVSRYVAIKTTQRSHASRTFDQLRNRGLIGAAEYAVCRNRPTDGFKTLDEANERDVSYEQIVVSHPEEFSARALWYSRQTLGFPNKWSRPPAEVNSITHVRTKALLQWLRVIANNNHGVVIPFTNSDAAAVVGLNPRTDGVAHGNIQSRIDYACYLVGLPPLGLTAAEPYETWAELSGDPAFRGAAILRAARHRVWSDTDFDNLLREIEQIPAQAPWAKTEQDTVKAWVRSFETDDDEPVEETEGARRNARWSRDELILALELYMRHRVSPPSKGAPEIAVLSSVLNKLGVVLGQRISETYRNENGVYMKLMNFRSLDPEYTAQGKTGLSQGNKDEALVWDEFAGDVPRLAEVAQFIRDGITEHSNDIDLAGPDEPGIEEAEEGRVATRVHRCRERDRRLVEAAKKQARERHGRLFCVACDFDFSKRYGDLGDGIIDVHHTKPVHTMRPGEKTKVSDLILLCSNCHRIVHSKRKWLTLEQLRAALGR